MKVNLKNLINRYTKLKKQVSLNYDNIKKKTLSNEKLLEEIKIVDNQKLKLSEELTKKEKLLSTKEKELDERKIKLEQFKILLMKRAKELKDEKFKFQRVKRELLNMSSEIDDDILKDFKDEKKYQKKNIVNGILQKNSKN